MLVYPYDASGAFNSEDYCSLNICWGCMLFWNLSSSVHLPLLDLTTWPVSRWAMEASPSFWAAVSTFPSAEYQEWHLYDCVMLLSWVRNLYVHGTRRRGKKGSNFLDYSTSTHHASGWTQILPCSFHLLSLRLDPTDILTLFTSSLISVLVIIFPPFIRSSSAFNFLGISIISDLLRALNFISSDVFN